MANGLDAFVARALLAQGADPLRLDVIVYRSRRNAGHRDYILPFGDSKSTSRYFRVGRVSLRRHNHTAKKGAQLRLGVTISLCNSCVLAELHRLSLELIITG